MTKYSKSNVLVGDNVLILKTASGEKIACPRHAASLDPLEAGDKVVITPRANGIKDCCLVSSLNVGDKVAINQLQSGEKIALKLTEQFNQTIQVNVPIATNIPIASDAPIDLGTYQFKWDGETPVRICGVVGGMAIILSSVLYFGYVALGVISVTATTTQGTLSTLVNIDGGYPFHPPEAADLEITSLLKRGDNNIQIQITSTITTTFQVGAGIYITVQNVGAAVTAD